MAQEAQAAPQAAAPEARAALAFPLPDECEPEVYRQYYPDLAPLSDQDLKEHYALYGAGEGRLASTGGSRPGFLGTIPPEAEVLEIGPFYWPSLVGPNITYFDVLDRDSLVERATSIGMPTEQIPHIHYCQPDGDLSVVDRRFDVVLTSHCIEHQPDLVHHLNQVESLLRPGGYYFLVIPDKRYCFDHYIGESTIRDVLAAHFEGRRLHTARSVIEHRMLITHNEQQRHWAGDHGELRLDWLPAALEEAQEAAHRYVDVHAWQFTPDSFRNIVTLLNTIGLTGLKLARVYATVHNCVEFNAVLQRP